MLSKASIKHRKLNPERNTLASFVGKGLDANRDVEDAIQDVLDFLKVNQCFAVEQKQFRHKVAAESCEEVICKLGCGVLS